MNGCQGYKANYEKRIYSDFFAIGLAKVVKVLL